MSITENKTMKAVLLESINGKFKITSLPIPSPTENQVLIKMISSPINPSDIGCVNGIRLLPFPTQLGAEGYGTVVKAGDPKGEKLVGKKVSFYTFQPNCWSEYAIVGLHELMESAPNSSIEVGATTYLNAVTTLGLVDNVKKGNHKAVIITTAGVCSRMMFKLFKEEGIKTVAVVRKEEQKKVCLDNGADFALNSSDEDYETKLKKTAADISATACIECVLGDTLRKILRNMPRRSEIILYGKLNDNDPFVSINFLEWMMNESSIRPYIYLAWITSLSEEKREEVYERIRKNLKDIFKTDISKVFKLEEINEAYEYYLNNMTQGKIILKIGE